MVLDTSFVAACPRNEVPDGCKPGFGAPVAQIVLFAAVQLLIGQTPMEGSAVSTEAAGPFPVRNKLDACGPLVKWLCAALVAVLTLTMGRFEGFKMKTSDLCQST